MATEGAKEFGRFAEALVAYENVRKPFIEENPDIQNWDSLQNVLRSFKEAMSILLRDYAYSGGGIFPAIIGTLLLVLGAMLIAIILGVFCAIFFF